MKESGNILFVREGQCKLFEGCVSFRKQIGAWTPENVLLIMILAVGRSFLQKFHLTGSSISIIERCTFILRHGLRNAHQTLIKALQCILYLGPYIS